MIIVPYKRIDSLEFCKSNAADCVKQYGEPIDISTDRVGKVSYSYPERIIRFDSVDGTLRDCTLLPFATAKIESIPVTWDRSFLESICLRDGHPVAVQGFIILPSLGISVTGIHDNDRAQLFVGVSKRGLWDDILKFAKPFDLASLR